MKSVIALLLAGAVNAKRGGKEGGGRSSSGSRSSSGGLI